MTSFLKDLPAGEDILKVSRCQLGISPVAPGARASKFVSQRSYECLGAFSAKEQSPTSQATRLRSALDRVLQRVAMGNNLQLDARFRGLCASMQF